MRNFITNSTGNKLTLWKCLPFLYCGLATVLIVALLSGCSLPYTSPDGPKVTESPEVSYSVTVSATPIQISGGNLHWHRELPSDSYTLEDVALEIQNLGDFDIAVAQLEIMVDEDCRLFNLEQVIAGGAKTSVTLQTMMEGYDGGIHRIYLSLLDDEGGVLYQNEGQEIGPLEPETGTGDWQSMPG